MPREVCRRAAFTVGLAVLVAASAGCHRVIIDSGLQPAAVAYDQEWNIAFALAIYPAQIDASQYCGGRFATVETQLSFLNGVVNNLTGGIITPMSVRLVCAAGSEDAEPEASDATPRQSNQEEER